MQCVVAGEMVQLSPLDVQRAGVLQQFASARQIVLPLTRDELSLWLHFASLPNPCPAALVMVMHVRSSARADLDGVAGLQEAHVRGLAFAYRRCCRLCQHCGRRILRQQHSAPCICCEAV